MACTPTASAIVITAGSPSGMAATATPTTIMKMLAGVHQPDSGTLVLRGEPVVISDPLHARKLGVSIVFQELNLFPHLTVAGNIFANREATVGPGLLNERQMVAATRNFF